MGGHSSAELPVAIGVYGGGAGILMRIIQIKIVTLDKDRKALYAHFKPLRRTWIFTFQQTTTRKPARSKL